MVVIRIGKLKGLRYNDITDRQNWVIAPELQNMLGHTTLSMTTHHLKNITPADEIWEKANRILG